MFSRKCSLRSTPCAQQKELTLYEQKNSYEMVIMYLCHMVIRKEIHINFSHSQHNTSSGMCLFLLIFSSQKIWNNKGKKYGIKRKETHLTCFNTTLLSFGHNYHLIFFKYNFRIYIISRFTGIFHRVFFMLIHSLKDLFPRN